MSELEIGKRKYFVGELINIQGTGKYWHGLNYAAVIVDIRDSDKTVKIHYTEGGYKRLSFEEFKKLVVMDDTEEGTYRLKAYEMDEDYYDPTAEAVGVVSPLQPELNKALETEDFKKANEIKLKMQEIMTKAEKLKSAQYRLRTALRNQDFLEAEFVYLF
jgi:hypothetical protein